MSAYLAVDKNGREAIYPDKPSREDGYWYLHTYDGIEIDWIDLPKGSIKRLIGKELTWSDEPVELKESMNENEVNRKFLKIFETKLPNSPDYRKAFIDGYSLALESQGGTLGDLYSHDDYPGHMGCNGSKSDMYNTLLKYHNMCCPFKNTCTYSAGTNDCTELCDYQKKFGELINEIIE